MPATASTRISARLKRVQEHNSTVNICDRVSAVPCVYGWCARTCDACSHVCRVTLVCTTGTRSQRDQLNSQARTRVTVTATIISIRIRAYKTVCDRVRAAVCMPGCVRACVRKKCAARGGGGADVPFILTHWRQRAGRCYSLTEVSLLFSASYAKCPYDLVILMQSVLITYCFTYKVAHAGRP